MIGGQKRAFYIAVILITALAGGLRWRAVWRLPVDFDELAYLPVAFRYEEMLAPGKWNQILQYKESMEHPPLNKLLFAADLRARHPKEPDWDRQEVGRQIAPEDRPAYTGPRLISAIGGTLQVLLVSLVHPLGGLLLALNSYHIKYSAQVYLEGVPGLMAVLAVFLFDRAFARRKDEEAGKQAPPRTGLLIASAASLGLAAGGKYLYGIAGLVLLAFLVYRTRSARIAFSYCVIALAVFLASDPYLWPNPPGRLWDSLTYHWRYSHSRHVVESGLPWYEPFYHLLHSQPTHWHPGVFYTGLADVILLPLALIGVVRAWRERPVWLAWAGVGLVFLLLWSTKWAQYILLILPPLTVCAGIAIEQVARGLVRLRKG